MNHPFLRLSVALLVMTQWPMRSAGDGTDDARLEFKAGIAALEEENFPEALAAFKASYELNPKKVVLYNIGMCQKALFKYKEALETFESLLGGERAGLSPSRWAEAEQSKLELERQVAALTLESGTEGGMVLLDGKEVGALPLEAPLLLDPGSHILEIRKEGYERYREELRLELGERRTLALAPLRAMPPAEKKTAPEKTAPAPSKESPAPAEPPPPPPLPKTNRRAKLFLAFGIAGLTLGIGGVTAAIINNYLWYENYNSIEWLVSDCRDDWRESCKTKHRALERKIGINEAFLVSGYVAGGVLTITGVVMMALYSRRKKRRVSAAPMGLSVQF